MKNLFPVFFMHETGVENHYLQAALDGIQAMLQEAKVLNFIQIINYGVWRNDNYIQNNQLIPYQSLDWYIGMGRADSRRLDQLNASKILALMNLEAIRESVPHFDVCILRQDLNNGSNDNNFVVGVGSETVGTVVSTNRFGIVRGTKGQYEVFKTVVMHEFGHVLGLIVPARQRNIIQHGNLGPHCASRCIMRQGYNIVDFARYTQERLSTRRIICIDCSQELSRFFS